MAETADSGHGHPLADPPASMEEYDRVRVLRSSDVQYGRPVYFQHVLQDSEARAAPPYAHNPFRSGENVQHFVAVRSRDPKPLGISHPEYGFQGRVFVQEAFDKKGRLRLRPGEEVSLSGPPAQAVPSEEAGGNIFLHLGGREGERRVAEGVEIVRGVPTAYSKARPTLSARLVKAAALGLSRTVQELQERSEGVTPPRAQTPKSTPKIGRRSSSVSEVAPATPADDEQAGLAPLEFESPAHRRLFSSQVAGPEHAQDKVMESILAIFEEKAPGQPCLPVSLGSALGKLAMRSGEVGLEGCGFVETPFTTARSTLPSKFDGAQNMADVDEMLRAVLSPTRKVSKAIARLSQAGGAQVANDALNHQRDLDDQEKALKHRVADLSAERVRRVRRVEFLKKDIERCEKDEADVQKMLQDLIDISSPMRKQMEEVNYRVAAQQKILEKYKEEHGEKGIYKTLRKEIKEELNSVQDVKDELAQLEPKEKSKRKQFEEKQRQTEEVRKDLAKMESKMNDLEQLESAAKAELKSFRNMKKEVLAELAKQTHASHSLEASPANKPSSDAFQKVSPNEKHGEPLLGAHDHDGTVEQEGAAHAHPREDDEDPDAHKAFASASSWLRRHALAMRAKSPRWRDRLLKELQLFKVKNPDRMAMKPKYNGSEPLVGAPPSAFIAKVKMPTSLCRRWESFCKRPPPQFEPCTEYKVTFDSRSIKHVQVTFPAEPKGYLHSFILAFKQNVLSEDDVVFADQIATLYKQVVEKTTFTSLRERWALEGLIADGTCDMESLQAAAKPRLEEKLYKDQHFPAESLLQELDERADHKLIEKISMFKDAPLALVEALVKIASVLLAPAQTKVIDQGTIGDAMYYVVSGSLLKRWVQGPGGIPLGAIGEGECFCERHLIEVRPNDATVETVKACKLYRFRTKQFMDILSPFPGFYEGLIKLDWKRVAEWEELNSGKVKKDSHLPFRWNQLAGPAFHTLKSSKLRAEIDTAPLEAQSDTNHVMLAMLERRGEKPCTPPLKWPAGINRWGKVDLTLNTKCMCRDKPAHEIALDARAPDWWKDKLHLTEADTLTQARSHPERYAAIETRASAFAWRRHELRGLGRSMVNSIS
jgi:CRP-like cAMP-binding protein